MHFCTTRGDAWAWKSRRGRAADDRVSRSIPARDRALIGEQQKSIQLTPMKTYSHLTTVPTICHCECIHKSNIGKGLNMIHSQKQNPPQRTLHLIDIENQLGTPRVTADEIAEWFHEYASRVAIGPLDQIVIAVGTVDGLIGLATINCRRLVKFGANGADLALLNVLNEENVARRFNRVNLASGDGIFTPAVAELAAAGVTVTVISRPHGLAARLRMAAAATITFELTAHFKEAAY